MISDLSMPVACRRVRVVPLGDQQTTILTYYSHWVHDDTEVIRDVLDDVLSTQGDTGDEVAL